MAALMLCLLLLVMPSGTVAAAKQPKCLACHRVHYQDKGRCTTCHRGNPDTSRKTLAHSNMINSSHAAFTMPESAAVQRGKKLAEQFACRRCHILDNQGTRLAANLDYLLQNSTTAQISTAIKVPALYMPDFRLRQVDHDALVTFILSAGLKARPPQAEPPQVVYFTDWQADRQNVFVKKCGDCHKLLSAELGGLGTGEYGPALSGLLTVFYPANYKDEQSWNLERLKKWLENPRKIRPATTMRPVQLTAEEWSQLGKVLEVPPDKMLSDGH